MKKLLTFILLLCAFLQARADTWTDSNGIKYELYSNGTATVISGDYSSLTSVNIPSTVTKDGTTYTVTAIGNDSFYNRANLKSVTFPSTLTTIGQSAFYGCSGLRILYIPEGVTTIDALAFYSTSLAEISLPSTLTSIGSNAFQLCPLTVVNCWMDSPLDILDNTFYFNNFDERPCSLHVPAGSFQAYQNHNVWSRFSIVLPRLNYQFNDEDGTAKVIAGNYSSLTSIEIPYNELRIDNSFFHVTAIGNSAFYQCTNLTSVTIPSSVTTIGNQAFQLCTNLTDLTIPWGVTSIGDAAFNYCYGLTSITIPETVTTIGSSTFARCDNLESIIIPEGVTSIGYRAFHSTKLSSVTLPSTLTAIGEEAFGSCRYLSSVTCLVETPLDINQNTFSYYNNVPLYVPEGSVSAYQNHAVWGQFNIIAIPTVTSTIDGITYQFKTDGTATVIEGAATLRNANIPETVPYEDEEYTVTVIGSNAFANSSNLKTVILPATLTDIRPGAFYGTTLNYVICQAQTPPSLPTRNLALSPAFGNISNTPLYVPEGRVAAYNAATGWKEFAKIFEIQTTINNIQYALVPGKREVVVVGSTGNLTNLIIPGTVTYMGVSFDVTSIGPSAFLNNTNLRQVAIGEGVKTIGDEAFRGCTRITGMTLPSTLEEIGTGALYGLTNLTTLYCNATTPPTVSRATFNTATYTNCTLYVPYGSVSTYKAKSYWKSFNIAGVGTVDDLRYKFIEDGETLTAEVIEGDYSSLTSVTIPSWVLLDNKVYVVKGIGDNAFNGYTGLTTVNIGGTVTRIGASAFSGCTGLRGLTIPESVTTIGNSAFRGCTGLTTLFIESGLIDGEGLESIEASAFRDCSSLTSVTIPSTVTSIGSYAFQGCTSLTSVTCDLETPLDIADNVFVDSYDNATLYVDASSLEAYRNHEVWGRFSNITFSTATIDGIKYSFNHTTGEATVIMSDYSGDINIPETVTCNGMTYQVIRIGDYAFHEQPITSVTLPSTVKAIGSSAFSGCRDMTSVTIPEGVKSIGSRAFAFCTALTSITIPSSVEHIRTETFIGCQGLTNITIPSSVGNIGSGAFIDCQGLKSVTFLDGDYVVINESAFKRCTSLTTVSLPSSMVYLGMSAFAECTNLNTVYCDAPTPLNITSDVFSSYDTATLFVPAGSIEAYEDHEVWGLFNTVWDKDAELYSGDVNGDKRINVGDFIATGSFILGRIPSPFIFKDGDINEDGNINVGDFIAIGSIILHSTSTNANSGAMSAPRRAGEVATVDLNPLDNALYIAPVTAVPGTQAVLSLRMKNTEPTTGFELNLRLPEGVTVATGSDNMPMAELSEERTSKSRTNFFATSLQADGTLKVLCGTNAGSQTEGLYAFSGNDGEVARITVNIPDDYVGGEYAVSVLNGALADVNASTTELAPELTILNSSMTIQQSLTGINVPVSIDGAPSGDYYTLDGLKLEGKPTKKGIYILNGKKVLVK